MAVIFVSYTSSDRDWAFWIGHELEALGHTPHLHDWEISGGGNVMAWMTERTDAADHVLCVVSEKYLSFMDSARRREKRLCSSRFGRLPECHGAIRHIAAEKLWVYFCSGGLKNDRSLNSLAMWGLPPRGRRRLL